MAKFLIHVTTGPDNPTKAALAFFVARAVLEEGHELALFIAGDAVHCLTAATAETLEGLGTGKLGEHIAAINQGQFQAFYSGMSAKARGITQEQVLLRGAEPAMPTRLVQLTAACDKVLCY